MEETTIQAQSGALPLTGKSLLIVDDSKVIRMHLHKIISAFGGNVIECEDPIEAIMLIKEQAFDLVVLDLQMPYMNGKNMLHYVRAKLKNPVPVVICSTINDPQLLLDLSKMRIVDFLLKPFDDGTAARKIVDAVLKPPASV